DVYSFTATLFTVLFGRAPFEVAGEEDAVELVRRIRRGGLVIPERPIPDSLRALLREGLATEPTERPALEDLLVRLDGIVRELPADADAEEPVGVGEAPTLTRGGLFALHGDPEQVRKAERAIIALEDAGQRAEASDVRWRLVR